MIHQYQNNGYLIVMDINSRCVHTVDQAAYDVIACLNARNENQTAETLRQDETWEAVKAELKDKYPEEELREIYLDLNPDLVYLPPFYDLHLDHRKTN